MTRKFYVRRNRMTGRWYWCCTLCQPTACGSRWTWQAILANSMPHHFSRRKYHHDYVRRTAA